MDSQDADEDIASNYCDKWQSIINTRSISIASDNHKAMFAPYDNVLKLGGGITRV